MNIAPESVLRVSCRVAGCTEFADSNPATPHLLVNFRGSLQSKLLLVFSRHADSTRIWQLWDGRCYRPGANGKNYSQQNCCGAMPACFYHRKLLTGARIECHSRI